MALLRHWLLLACGIILSAFLLPGIDHNDNWGALALVVLLLSLFNLILKPLLILATLPFIILTMGLGVWIINAVLLYFAAHLVDGFYVSSFWSALGASLIISLVNMLYTRITRPKSPRQFRGKRDDVIDI